MTQRGICDYLGHHGLSQSGPRQLLNWRVAQFRQGLPVVRPPAGPMQWAPVVHTVIDRHAGGQQGGLLSIPPDVVAKHVFPCLSNESLLAFLRVSRVFYAHCWRALMARAQRLLGPIGSSPLALSCYYYYARLAQLHEAPVVINASPPQTKRLRAEAAKDAVPDDERTIARSKLHKNSVARALHIPLSRFSRVATYLAFTDVATFIRLSIDTNGSIDVLTQLPAYRAQQELALDAQKRYIAECKPARLADVNGILERQGLGALGGFPLSPHATSMVELVCGAEMWRTAKRLVDNYVDMKDGTNTAPMVFSTIEHARQISAIKAAVAAFAGHGLDPATEIDPSLFALVSALVRDPFTPSNLLFSRPFLTTQWPLRGTLLCLVIANDEMRIVQLADHHVFNRIDMVPLLVDLEGRHLGKVIKFPAHPSLGSRNPPNPTTVFVTSTQMVLLLCGKLVDAATGTSWEILERQ